MTAARSSADVVIVTRFNLPSPGVESMIRAQDGWLRNRVELFERYCLPSVCAQSDRDFRWIIYFDPQSPSWLRERLQPHVDAERFRPLLHRESVGAAELIEDIEHALDAPRADELITINLDNDDAVAADFVARVRDLPTDGRRTAIFFGNGLIRRDGALFLRRDESNAFRAVREPWTTPMTCWADWHIRLGRHMPVTVVDGAPAWLQVVHGQNVSNRVRGRLVAPAGYGPLFPGALDDLQDPGIRERARDLLVARPLRFVRETARASLKHVVLAVLGKGGFDRLKYRVGHVRAKVTR